jgi:hypothetical protein
VASILVVVVVAANDDVVEEFRRRNRRGFRFNLEETDGAVRNEYDTEKVNERTTNTPRTVFLEAGGGVDKERNFRAMLFFRYYFIFQQVLKFVGSEKLI